MLKVLRLAEERGFRGSTFATQDELNTPGYQEAWERGRLRRDRLIEDACRAEVLFDLDELEDYARKRTSDAEDR